MGSAEGEREGAGGAQASNERSESRSRASSPVEEFWKWFAENAPRFAAIPPGMENVPHLIEAMKETNRRLRAVDLGLTSEMSVGEVDGKRELVLSADGVAKRIPAVVKVVAAAPKVEGWRIIAFRQRKPRDEEGEPMVLNYEGAGFDPKAMRFVARKRGPKVDLAVFGPGLSKRDKRAMGAVFLLLDALLGEYDVMTKVGGLEFLPLTSGQVPPGSLPLAEVARAVDALLGAKG